MKQINRQNEDGSYSYGYEGADGSYKIETKQATGEVFGKYGYLDDTGSLREVEYGASRRGFEPAGQGIEVAPPTLTNNNNNNYLGPNDQDDGQYREDPSIYYKDPRYNDGYSYTGTSSSSSSRQQPSQPRYQQAYSPPRQTYSQPSQTYSQPSQPSYNAQPSYSQSNYNTQPSYDSQPRYSQPRYDQEQDSYYNSQPRQPIYVDPNLFRGHPASNFDVNTGSYSISYKK